MTDRSRSLASWVAVGVAFLLLPLAMIAVWIDGYVANTDRYVEAVAPLADEPEVQAAVSQAVAGAAFAIFSQEARSTVCQETASQPANPLGGLAGLAGGLAGFFEGPIKAGLDGIVQSPTFERAWVSANRAGHEQLLAVLDGDDSQVDENGCVSLELGPVLQEVTDSMTGGLLPVTLPDVDVPVATIDFDDLSAARTGYSVLQPLGVVLPMLWVFVVAGALVVSRRRWWTLAGLGAVSAAGGVIVILLANWVRNDLIGASGDADVTGAIWDAVAEPLRFAALAALVVGLLVVAGGGAMGWRSSTAEQLPGAAR